MREDKYTENIGAVTTSYLGYKYAVCSFEHDKKSLRRLYQRQDSYTTT